MKAERFALLLTGTTLLVLGTLRWYGFTGNISESEPIGLYLKIPGAPERGGMVALRPLMKHVAAIAGDTVEATPQGSYINGKLWPNSGIPANTHGYRPFPFGTYTLQPGQFWLLGSSSDSWDSRWIGPVTSDLIVSNVIPLWTSK
jgi:conjugal transfer pilin signal peptidase TrbI